MGRKRKNGKDLPRGMIFSKTHGYRVTWYESLPGGGKRRRFKTFGPRLYEAEVFRQTVYGGSGEGLFGDVIDEWVKNVMAHRDLSERTARDYTQMIMKRLRPWIGHCKPSTIRKGDIAAYRDVRMQQSKKACREELRLFSQICDYAVERDWMERNPVKDVSLRVLAYKPRRQQVHDDDFALVLTMLPVHCQIAAVLSSITGMRMGDVLEVRFSDFSAKGLHRQQNKTGKRQVHLFTPMLRWCHDTSKALRPSSFFLVRRRDGQPYTVDGFQAIWGRAMRKAITAGGPGFERFTFHDIRSYAADRARRAGMDPSILLGHSSASITRRIYERAESEVTPVA